MRVQAITEVHTRHQHNPYLAQYADYTTIGKSAALVSFEECLRSQIQNASKPSVTPSGEWVAMSSLLGYFLVQEAAYKSEIKPKERAL